MKYSTLILTLTFALTEAKVYSLPELDALRLNRLRQRTRTHQTVQRRRDAEGPSGFLNGDSEKFLVNGSAIPEVGFDVGESYAGILPVGEKPAEEEGLFFWFFPGEDEKAREKKEIVIWLNGGPGCSSLAGLLQENGPFLWPPGFASPVSNPWSWNKLSNVVYIEQPIGVGFSRGNTSSLSNERDVARQFASFWKNFIDTFAMQGYKVYITGESYAGMYCSYIADYMLSASEDEKQYFDVGGVLLYDSLFGNRHHHQQVVALTTAERLRNLMPLNDTFRAAVEQTAASCDFTSYVDKYLTFPPAGIQPIEDPGTGPDGIVRPECAELIYSIIIAVLTINPCFSHYKVSTTCPFLNDPLSGSVVPDDPNFDVYFDREDVKKAVHVPTEKTWSLCEYDNDVLPNDDVEWPTLSVLPGIIEKTQNVMIAQGALDYILPIEGALLAIQNMSWGGELGFQEMPASPFFVPEHGEQELSTLGGAGILGTTHTERGLTYVGVNVAGHMLPADEPAAAFRHLEVLLGRVESLMSREPFTIYPWPQPGGPLGNGTIYLPSNMPSGR